MKRIHWRWAEKDYGFRFRSGRGKSVGEYYQAREPGTFYVVPEKQRKLSDEQLKVLALAKVPTSPSVVPIPWKNYSLDWDWIATDDGVLLNYAGCLDREEIERREDEGVARAMEFVSNYLERDEPTRLTNRFIQQVHEELLGAIYPFAGSWRTVSLHKGDGPTKWPLPPVGIGPLMDDFERSVLSRSPFLSSTEREVFSYVAEVMGELLAIHPFREGNGRTAFIVGNFLLMQNGLQPLDVYNRKSDETRYYAACEQVRIHKDYQALATLTGEWHEQARATKRVDVKEVLANADLRRQLMVSTIRATQLREHIETTPEQADRAYYVVTEGERAAFFGLEQFKDGKADRRQQMFVGAVRGEVVGVRHDVARRDFSAIEQSPLAFGRVGIMAPVFRESTALEPGFATVKQGLATSDDERWLRMFWEVPPESIGREAAWVPFAKGGDFSRFFSDQYLVIKWKNNGRELKDYIIEKEGSESKRIYSQEWYFKPGLTWPRRTQRGFNVRVMPAGCIFGDKGPAIFPKAGVDPFFILGVANSAPAEFLLRGLMSFGSWEVGVVKRLPMPSASPVQAQHLSELAQAIHDAKRDWDCGNETSTLFQSPWVLREQLQAKSLPAALDAVLGLEVEAEKRIKDAYDELNREVYRLFAIPDGTRAYIDENLGERAPEVIWPQMEGKSPEQKRMEHVWRLLSYVVKRVIDADDDGVVPFGRAGGDAPLIDRVRQELAELFRERDESQLEAEITNELKRGAKGYRKCVSIEDWLANAFFEYHASLYKDRPIFWHIASSQGASRFAFGALVHYHRFDKNRIAKLRASYIRDTIEDLRREAALADKAGRTEDRIDFQEKLEEAQALDKKLQQIEEGHHEGPEGGDRDFRILTPWKAPATRPKGWNPDLDDGVKVNIGPFDRAGILRVGGVAG